MQWWATIGGIVCLALVNTVTAATNVTDAVPLQAIPAILDLFKTNQVVGLGEGPHGNLEGLAFRIKLIRDPRFPLIVNDILVESGTARYQEVMDRFIRGESVARQELRRAWEDTTNPGTNWDKPMYEEFFTAVRDVNAKLPKRSTTARAARRSADCVGIRARAQRSPPLEYAARRPRVCGTEARIAGEES